MRQEFKDAVLISAGIMLFILSIVGISALISSSRHESPEVLKRFASSAIHFHDRINDTDLLLNIEILIQMIPEETISNSTEIEDMLKDGRLGARSYQENLGWLQPTTDTIFVYESLLRESALILSCYSNLTLAWSAKQSGDDASCLQYCDETIINYEELEYLRLRNRTYLDNLQLQAELE